MVGQKLFVNWVNVCLMCCGAFYVSFFLLSTDSKCLLLYIVYFLKNRPQRTNKPFFAIKYDEFTEI